MSKQASRAQGEIALGSEVLGEKRPKLFDPNEEAQKSLAINNMDSPYRTFDA